MHSSSSSVHTLCFISEAGIFYSEGEVENSKSDMNIWGSLASLKGKDFTRKREMIPHPTAMTVHCEYNDVSTTSFNSSCPHYISTK